MAWLSKIILAVFGYMNKNITSRKTLCKNSATPHTSVLLYQTLDDNIKYLLKKKIHLFIIGKADLWKEGEKGERSTIC